jgi:hypothetical protein
MGPVCDHRYWFIPESVPFVGPGTIREVSMHVLKPSRVGSANKEKARQVRLHPL